MTSTTRRRFLSGAALLMAAAILAPAGSVSAATGPYLVKDISTSGHSFPDNLTSMGGKLYFTAEGGRKGRELWVSDGTGPGTKRVKDIRPGRKGSNPESLRAIGNLLFFNANSGAGQGNELFRTDGTSAGTFVVKDINPGPGHSYPKGFAEFNGVAYFSADDGVTGHELWRTDGSTAGTWRVKDIAPGPDGSNPSDFVTFAGKLVFLRWSCPTAECFSTLYKTDGTASGTKPFRDRHGQIVSGHISSLQVVGSRLFFILEESEIWRSNGGSSTLRSLGAFGPDGGLVGSGGNAFFNVGGELWKSNGTTAGTVEVKDMGGIDFMIDVSGTLFFVAGDGKLYKSDGTEAGTVEVFQADPGEPVTRGDPTKAVIGATLYYLGPSSTGDGGCLNEASTLWQSDGTPDGTFEISPTPSNCQFEALTPVGNALFFVVREGEHCCALWRYVP